MWKPRWPACGSIYEIAVRAVLCGHGRIPELREIIKAAEQRRTRGWRPFSLWTRSIDSIRRSRGCLSSACRTGNGGADRRDHGESVFRAHCPLAFTIACDRAPAATTEALGRFLDRAVADTDRGLGLLRLTIQPAARDRLIAFGNGDARSLLTTLEFVAGQAPVGMDGRRIIDEAVLEAALLKKGPSLR